jgi:hypothetical protein
MHLVPVNDSFRAEFILSGFTDFVIVNGFLEPNTTHSTSRPHLRHIAVKATLIRDGGELPNSTDLALPSEFGSIFTVSARSVAPGDRLRVILSVICANESVIAIGIESTSGNPGALEFAGGVHAVMAGFVLYMLGVYLVFLRLDDEKFTQFFLIVLGITGAASWPGPPPYSEELISGVRFTLFVNVMRLFLILQLELVRTSQFVPSVTIRTALYIASVFCVTVEAVVEQMARVFDFLFALLVVRYIAVAFSGAGQSPRRFAMGSAMAAGCAAAPIVAGLIGTEGSIVSRGPMMVSAVYLGCTAAALFLMHSAVGRKYTGISDDLAHPPRIVPIDLTSDRDELKEEETESLNGAGT